MRAEGVVLAMGTFDGVHRGHAAVLKKAVARARVLGVPSLAMAFRRPPRLFFSPQKGPVLLTLPHEKESLFSSAGIHRADILTFGKRLSRLSADDFFDRYIRRRWKAREIVVGYDFAFGRGRRGTPAFLREKGASSGVPVHVVPPVRWRGAVVSSGNIRRRLLAGELSKANAELGHPYSLIARVVRGDGRGRRLGFPTANFSLRPEKIVPPGVFAVRVLLPDGSLKGGMANVGTRPTLAAPDLRPTVEAHIFRFSGSLAGKVLRVFFIEKLRKERRFPSLDALKRQLSRDARAARAALSRGPA